MNESIITRMRAKGSCYHLALARIIIGGHLLWLYLVPGNLQFLYSIKTKPIQAANSWIIPDQIELIFYLYSPLWIWIGIAFAITMILGIFPRISSFGSFVCFVATHSFLFQATYYHNEWPYLWFPLLVLSCSRCGDSLTLVNIRCKFSEENAMDAKYSWPIELCAGYIGCIYFFAGLAKITPFDEGIRWLNGSTLQWVTVTRLFDSPWYLYFGQPLFDYNQKWVFSILAILAVIIELMGCLLLYSRRYLWLCIIGFYSFHLGVIILSGMPGFLHTLTICMVFFIDKSKTHDFIVKKLRML